MRLCAIFVALSIASGALTHANPPANTPATKDAFGDPLPAGAKFQLGTSRFVAGDYSRHSRSSFTLSPDGRFFAVTQNDTVILYSSETGLALWKSSEPQTEEPVTGRSITFSGDGSTIATSSGVNVAIWDSKTGKRLSVGCSGVYEVTHLALNADFTRAVTIVKRGETCPAKIWNPKDGKDLSDVTPALNDIHAVDLSGDGRTLAVFGDYIPTDNTQAESEKQIDLEGVVQLWDLTTKKERPRIAIPSLRGVNLNGRERQSDEVPSLRLSPDGATLYTATRSAVEAWDTKTGKRVRQFPGRTQARGALSLAPDGKRLASVGLDGSIDVWSCNTGERLSSGRQPVGEKWERVWSGSDNEFLVTSSAPLVVALPPDGSAPIVGTLDANRARVGGLANTKPQSQGHRAAIRAVGYSADATQIVTVGGAEAIHWNATTGKQTGAAVSLGRDGRSLSDGNPRDTDSVLSPDGRTLAVSDGEGVKLIDLNTGNETVAFPLPDEGAGVRSMAFSQDGRRLATAISIFGEKKQADVLVVWNTATGKVVFENRREGDTNSTNRVLLSPDGSKLFSANSKWTVWDTATGKHLGPMQLTDAADSVAVPLSDNRSILTDNSDGKLAVLDLVDGKYTQTFDWDANTTPVISANGKLLALQLYPELDEQGKATHPPQVVICDLATGKAIRKFAATSTVGDWFTPLPLAFSPDGKFLVTGHANGTATVWEIAALPVAK